MRIFLDANVVADWILLKNKNISNVDDIVLAERYRQMGFSFKLIEKILNSEKQIALTSELVLAEVFGVIHDDAINMKLFSKAVPASSWYWASIRDREILEEDEALEIYDGIMKKLDELFPKIELVEDVFNLELIGYLILNLRLSTHDAILITTALENEASHFVTRDSRLIEYLRDERFTTKFDLSVLRPQTLLDSGNFPSK